MFFNGDVFDVSNNFNLFLFIFFLFTIVIISAFFCSKTKETFGSFNSYDFFGLFSEIHLNNKSVSSRKMHSVIEDLPSIFQKKPNKNFVIMHTFAGVYERFKDTELFLEKFGQKPIFYKSYMLPWVYIAGLIIFSVKSTLRDQDFAPKSKRPVTRFLHAIRRIHRESLCYSMPLVRLPPLRVDPR
jgi:hypothetical protein